MVASWDNLKLLYSGVQGRWALDTRTCTKAAFGKHCLFDSRTAEVFSRAPECLSGVMLQQQAALGKPKCQAGGDCARTRAALNWPDHLPCVDPSKVSVPVDKSIALLKWFESLGHGVPELRELEAIKRRQAQIAPPTHLPGLKTALPAQNACKGLRAFSTKAAS